MGADRIIDTIRQALVVLDQRAARYLGQPRLLPCPSTSFRSRRLARTSLNVGRPPLGCAGAPWLFLYLFLDLLEAEDAAIEDHEIEIELPAPRQAHVATECREDPPGIQGAPARL